MKESEKSRYTDTELQEFKEIIEKKLASSTEELNNLLRSLQTSNENGTDDTGSVYKTLEDGSSTMQKESISQMAARLKKFIQNLQAALVRIENHTYGICRVTGKLISKERLKAVPHTTQSMEAKVNQYK
ncbi:MAG: TraR/DksA family transcriptional regulator [Bacteroidetes bacterium]|jgi:DnaK suppressor protein|nr:TraR/DksA family transcriptional regulator [Bacteroidota bacterium]